ncbi:hypothetical protein [Candidatus Thioglobus sp.]|uniref:hypothetical protein n=1 Tax=Candidatus Thioglobus sp. TaxID=2026721 RepID=UPI00262B44A0|nr:hypothetical protein [Candidatus Thioglobus sp.]
MTKLQHDKLTKHLAEKWKAPVSCAVCGKNDWNVSDGLYELREFHGGSMVIGGSALIPVSPVTCNNCGNTVLINPLIAGIELKGGNNE